MFDRDLIERMRGDVGMAYYYPGTRVLRNRFDIQDGVKLETVERLVVSARLSQLLQFGVTGRFDMSHVIQIHRFLFSDLYDWAGQFRDDDIFKSGSKFAVPDKISVMLDAIVKDIQNLGNLRILSRADYIEVLTWTLAGLNQAHPFREGNGRTQRVFLSQLALAGGYDLDFSQVSENSMRNACVAAGRGDVQLIRLMMQDCLRALPVGFIVPVNLNVVHDLLEPSDFDFSPIDLRLDARTRELARRARLLHSPSGNARDLSNWPDFSL